MPGSYTYAGGDTAKGSGIELYGVLESEKQFDDIREASRTTVQVSEPGILVQRILRGYGGEECKKIQEYIRRQLEEDQAGEQLTMGNF